MGLTTRQRFRQTITRPPPQCAVGLKPTRAHVVPSSDARGINKRYKIRFPGGRGMVLNVKQWGDGDEEEYEKMSLIILYIVTRFFIHFLLYIFLNVYSCIKLKRVVPIIKTYKHSQRHYLFR